MGSTSGHLLCGRYQGLPVDGSGSGYLRTACDYLHLGPVRAKLRQSKDTNAKVSPQRSMKTKFLMCYAAVVAALLSGCESTGMTPKQRPLAGVSAFDLSKDQELGLITDASAGNAEAAFRLYKYYDFVVLNKPKALVWLTRAAELEHPQAQYVLAKLLTQDNEVSNRDESRTWLEKAAKNGYPEAVSALQKLKDQK